MNALVFRHVPFEHAGSIAPALASRGISIEYAGPECEAPDWRSARGLIFMGGPMSANDNLPFLRREIAVIEQAVAEGKPVLGICLGAQLMARALGARVYPNTVKEIGWAPVRWAEAAGEDPLFHGLSSPELLFHWHGETFDLPAGAQLLASSADCPNQAFRYGPNAWALQFHLEVTREMIGEWSRQDVNASDVRHLKAARDPEASERRLAEVSDLVFGRWADLIN